jgi:hypothetical protein
LESEEDEEKDEDMEMESKHATKNEEDEENAKKKKKMNEEKNDEQHHKKKKKDKKSNKFMQVKKKKKRIMGLFFFKWNLFFTIKVLIILVISISYYLVSSIVNSNNKSNYLDFDQTTDAIEALYKQTYELYLKLKTQMEIFEERMRVKTDAINSFCDFNSTEIKYFNYSYQSRDKNNLIVNVSCNNIDCTKDNCNAAYAISCVNDVNCDDTIMKSMCEGLKCIDSIENYQMNIPSNEELTSPKLGSLLMPLVSAVDESSTETEIKLNNLYNNDSCKILVGQEDVEAYRYCSNFWSNILGKGMEQGITQLGLSVASVTDELNSLNDLSDVLNKKDNNNNNTNTTMDNPKTFDNLTKNSESAFFQFSIFVEFYLFESYLQTYKIFNVLRDVKLENIKNSFNIILYIYLIGSILLLIILLYFVYESQYLLNSFLNFVGIFPVKYIMEDNVLYHDTLNLEQNVF